MNERATEAPLATISRREGEEIRIAWSNYHGAQFLDCRLYFRASDGEMRPTRKGITLGPDQLEEFIAALQRALSIRPVGGSGHAAAERNR